ncbi:MAG: YraN family protein [Alphaproteobacteria bacterium]
MKTTSKGFLSEVLCAFILRLKGYRIIARNYKTSVGEIDVIARKGKSLVMVEVKYRPSKEVVHGVISVRQQQRILRAAQWFVSRHPQYNNAHIRFDAVLFWRFGMVHIQNAWGQ